MRTIIPETMLALIGISVANVAVAEKLDHKLRLAAEPTRDGAAGTIMLQQVAAAGVGGDIQSSKDAQSSEGSRSRTIAEVIVTAQKREERLQDVPIAISVLGGADLDTSTDEGVNDVLSQIPGVVVTQHGSGYGGVTLSVRGVTAGDAALTGSNPVGYYVDSVPYGMVKNALIPESNAYDLDRVEVLRGPQGTLYGANAMNGVVRILTTDPNLSAFEAKARASVSSTEEGSDNYRGDFAINVPIVPEKLALRAVAGYQDWGGWIDNLVSEDINGGNSKNLRLKLKAQPTEKFSVGLSGWFSRMDYGAGATGTEENIFPGVLDQFYDEDYDVFGLDLAYEFSGFSVSSTTSYIDFLTSKAEDIITVQELFYTTLGSKVLSEELLFRSTSEAAWRWTAGLFYRDAEDSWLQYGAGIPLPGWTWTDASESFAVFGELTRLFMDGTWELTGGLRYFEDDVSLIEHAQADFWMPPRTLIEKKDSFDSITPRVVLTWHPAQNRTLYASYSEGFRSGWQQTPIVQAAVPGFMPVSEDTLTNYELGMKGDLAQGRINYDIAAYYIEWEDVQQILGVQFSSGIGVVAGVNAGSASGPGVDLGASFRVLENLSVSASLGWNDLTLDAPVFSSGDLLYRKGDRLNLSAEWNAATSVDYQWGFGQSAFQGRFSTSASYTPSRTVRTINAYVEGSDSILDVGARFAVVTPAGWTATLYADNLTDENGSPRKTFPDFPMYDSRIRPRTVGVQFEYQLSPR